MEIGIFRELSDLKTDLQQRFHINTSVSGKVHLFNFGPFFSHPVFLLKAQILGSLISFLHLGSCMVFDSLQSFFGNTLLNELFTVDVSDWFHLVDDLVHQRLGEGGLVKLVMSELSVTDQVDDHVTLELLAELRSKSESALDILHRVGVNVEDRSVDRLGNISSVDARSALAGVSCETNLVVNNDVDGATSFVVSQRLHL